MGLCMIMHGDRSIRGDERVYDYGDPSMKGDELVILESVVHEARCLCRVLRDW